MRLKKGLLKTLIMVLFLAPFMSVSPLDASIEDYNLRTAVCEDWSVGEYEYWHLSPVNEKDEFYVGEKVQFFAQSDFINVPHSWSLKLYLEDELYRDVRIDYDPGDYGWNYSNFNPWIANLPAGDYRVEYYLDSGQGDEFVNSINFKIYDQLMDGLDPFVFHHAVTAESYNHGVDEEYWNLEPVNQKSEFSVGDEVKLLVQVRDIYKDHRYKVELYRDGEVEWDYTSEWFEVLERWSYGNFFPSYYDALPGEFSFKVYIDIGEGFSELATVPFSVSGDLKEYTYSHTYLATGWEYGEDGEYWNLRPINPGDTFNKGDDVYALSQVRNIYRTHQWKVELFEEDLKLWEYTSPWREVGSGWDYGNFFPAHYNAQPGDYTFKIYINSGSGFDLLDSKDFAVQGELDSLYFHHATTSLGWEHGEGDEYWNLRPVDQKETFYSGDDIYLMAQIRDVYVDHRYRVELYEGEQMMWGYNSDLLEVGAGWSYSNFFPVYYKAQPGEYEFWYYLDSGEGFELYGKVPFTVIDENTEGASIVDVAGEAGTFQALLTAVNAAGLADTLDIDGPYTVFAPSDEAFAKLPAGTVGTLLGDIPALQDVLLYHVVPGRIDAENLATLDSVETLQGGELTISSYDGIRVNNSNVVTADIMADNGIIHVIDTVLFPPQ